MCGKAPLADLYRTEKTVNEWLPEILNKNVHKLLRAKEKWYGLSKFLNYDRLFHSSRCSYVGKSAYYSKKVSKVFL